MAWNKKQKSACKARKVIKSRAGALHLNHHC